MSDLDYDALRRSAEFAAIRRRMVTVDPPTVLRLLDLAQRAEADRAAVERVKALCEEWRRHDFGTARLCADEVLAALDPKEDQ